MKSLDALSEVSREMELMAHFLQVVSHDHGLGADVARDVSQEIRALQRKIDHHMQVMTVSAPASGPIRVTARAGR